MRRPHAPARAARRRARRSRARGTVLVLAAALATSCSGEPSPAPAPARSSGAPTSAPAGSPSPGDTSPGDASPGNAPGTATEAGSRPAGLPGAPRDVVTGLDVPWDLAVLPDGTALVTLRDQARVLHVGPGLVEPVPAPGPDGRVPGVDPGGEGGLLGIALSPRFATDGQVFLYLTAARDNRIVRATYRDGRLSDPVDVLTGIPKARVHNGGRIRFGPDGMLYAGTGDATDGGEAQDPASLAGKVLRMTPEGAAPADNPFPGSPVYSLGHRNVQGLGWDAAGRLYASEFGQNTWDELNLIRPGGNYGWPEVEGPGGGGFVAPLHSWSPAEASPSGLTVTADAVWMAALRGQRLWRVPLTAEGATGTPEPYLEGGLGRIRAVEVGPDGTLWALSNNTFRGEPRPGDDRLVSIPLG